MRLLKIFTPMAWLLALAGAFGNPSQSGPWVSALVIPVAGAGFLWGSWASWLLALGGSLASVSLSRDPASIPWLAGSWISLAVVPFLFWVKECQRQAQQAQGVARGGEWMRQAQALTEERDKRSAAIRTREREISTIVELYGLSKRFLGTLDLVEALKITQETLEAELPRLSEPLRRACLDSVRAHLEKGEVTMERLMQALPASAGPEEEERFGIVRAQLALGLRRVGLYRRIQESATHDSLTGLWVRRYFLERLTEEVARSQRRGLTLAFLMVDLDHFKRVNDTYGHLVGDVVLKEVARLLARSVREVDLVGRYGGEEFAVALPEAHRALAVQVADRIRQTIGGAPLPAYDEKIGMTVSIGVALFPADAASAEGVIEKADQAMYRAKALGRNRTVTQ